MCVIIDADIASLVFAPNRRAAFEPVVNWLFGGKGMLVSGGQNRRELYIVQRARRAVLTLQAAGRAQLFNDAEIDGAQKDVQQQLDLTSDDPHVIALARVSRARTLCTHDGNLIRDFTDAKIISSPRGKVYQNASHARLLTHTRGCPGYRHR